MPKLFKKNLEILLIALAAIFSVVMLGCFIFGIMGIINGVENAFGIEKNGAESISFNIPDAAMLDLRGILKK